MFTQLLGLILLLGVIFFTLWGLKKIEHCDISSNFANIIANKVSKKEKLSPNDFKKNHDYYRDIIYNYSPVLLSYIDNFEINLPRDIIGNIMLLEQKGYVKIEDGIFIASDINTSKLSNLEKYILQNINSSNLTINQKDIIGIVQEEGLKKEVIVANRKYKKSNLDQYMHRFLFAILIISGIISVLEEIFQENELSYSLSLFNLIAGIVIIIVIFILLTNFFYERKLHQNRQVDPYFRTSKGEEINEKLEGLKEYLKDYSNMKNKSASEITLWEDYLIYSIIFEQNNIAISKYLKYIKVI